MTLLNVHQVESLEIEPIQTSRLTGHVSRKLTAITVGGERCEIVLFSRHAAQLLLPDEVHTWAGAPIPGTYLDFPAMDAIPDEEIEETVERMDA